MFAPEMFYQILVVGISFVLTQAIKAKLVPEGGTGAAYLAAVLSLLGGIAYAYLSGQLVGMPTEDPQAFLAALGANWVVVYALQTGLFKLVYRPLVPPAPPASPPA